MRADAAVGGRRGGGGKAELGVRKLDGVLAPGGGGGDVAEAVGIEAFESVGGAEGDGEIGRRRPGGDEGEEEGVRRVSGGVELLEDLKTGGGGGFGLAREGEGGAAGPGEGEGLWDAGRV